MYVLFVLLLTGKTFLALYHLKKFQWSTEKIVAICSLLL